jgi:hypothetical protein
MTPRTLRDHAAFLAANFTGVGEVARDIRAAAATLDDLRARVAELEAQRDDARRDAVDARRDAVDARRFAGIAGDGAGRMAEALATAEAGRGKLQEDLTFQACRANAAQRDRDEARRDAAAFRAAAETAEAETAALRTPPIAADYIRMWNEKVAELDDVRVALGCPATPYANLAGKARELAERARPLVGRAEPRPEFCLTLARTDYGRFSASYLEPTLTPGLNMGTIVFGHTKAAALRNLADRLDPPKAKPAPTPPHGFPFVAPAEPCPVPNLRSQLKARLEEVYDRAVNGTCGVGADLHVARKVAHDLTKL